MDIYNQHAYKHSIGWSTWHLQWCTKYRYKVFSSVTKRELCKIFLQEIAARNNFTIIDCEVDIDHVHVLASLPLTMTPSTAVHRLKGLTAYLLFRELPELRKFYPRGHLWSPGKFMASVGYITLEKAKNYLEAHHAKALSNRNPRSAAKRRSCPAGQGFSPRRMSIRLSSLRLSFLLVKYFIFELTTKSLFS